MHKKVTKQLSDECMKVRSDYRQLKADLFEHSQCFTEYMKYSTVILHHKSDRVDQLK